MRDFVDNVQPLDYATDEIARRVDVLSRLGA
jgi:hypothetical protein